MAWTAKHRFARISPRKARLVADMIRGRQVDEAMDLLRFTNRRASQFVYRTLRSAVANADEQEADVGKLYVSEARVDEGPRMKRWHPKDRGRAHPIIKAFSHIIVVVDQT
jgi:large subunit ribosomal protein L22